MIPNTLIIIGGGASIKKGLTLGLHDKIKDHFTCGCNYAFNYFDCTYTCFVDKKFYKKEQSNLSKLPLIIGKSGGYTPMSNTIDLPTATRYFRDLSGGTYSPDLTGIFALSLGIHLIDKGTIYLLGFDFGGYHTSNIEDAPLTMDNKKILALGPHKRPLTHFYQGERKHRGIGKTSFYNALNRPRDKFMPFITNKENKEKVKIYNVSPTSRIPNEIFEKLNYSTFFEKLEIACGGRCNHKEVRALIRKKLNS